MCLNSNMQMEQIEKFIEHGMPKKIVKTVQYTMRKRAKEHEKKSATVSQPEVTDTVTVTATATATVTIKSAEFADEKTTKESISTSDNSTSVPTPPLRMKSLTKSGILTNLDQDKLTIADASDNIKQKSEFKIPKLCGRFRQLQSISNDNANGNLVPARHLTPKIKANGNVYADDALAVSTQLTKQFASKLNDLVEKVQSSKIYTVFTRTTQPAHVLAICIFTLILFTVWPKLFANQKTTNNVIGKTVKQQPQSRDNTLAVIAYLGAFATHFGAQIWMTFVSGLSLYFSLPRHVFGQCQQILFPKYFAMNAILSICMLMLFVKYFLGSWNVANGVQFSALLLSAGIEVIVRLYLAPPMLRLMHEKYKIEDAIGSGKEVGSLVQGDLAQCPHYQRIHKTFRRIHMTIAMGNMTILLATCLQLYFLASKIQLS